MSLEMEGGVILLLLKNQPASCFLVTRTQSRCACVCVYARVHAHACVYVCPCFLGTESSFLLNESYCYACVGAASGPFAADFLQNIMAWGNGSIFLAHPAVSFLTVDQNNHVGQ